MAYFFEIFVYMIVWLIKLEWEICEKDFFASAASSCKTPVNRIQAAICIWQFVHAWGTQQRYSLGITGRLKANWAQKLMYSPHHK